MAENGMAMLDEAKRETQAGRLLKIAEQAEYWHTPQRRACATLTVREHRESHAVDSASFRDWLVHEYFKEHGHGPNSNSLKNALTLLTARATQAGQEQQAHLRIAEHDGDIYIDLGDPDWHVIRVSRDGWAVERASPVQFTRAQGTKPMPHPSLDGDIGDLYSMVNVREEDLPLLAGWLLGALYPRGPYPILLLQGPPGSAKSTLARTLKSIADPNDLELRAAPKDMRDLQIAALHSRCVALDNLPHVPQELSDTLCRLSTGEATSSRTLYTNTDETIVKVQCPVIITGIGAIASQADLLDRAIVLNLHIISGESRVPESEYWRRWDARKASVLGALLDAAVHGLRNLENTHLERLPRMADFAKWVAACEPALWERGTFLAAYDQNRSDAHEITLDADPVGHAIVEMMTTHEKWSGTASELLTALEWTAGEKAREQQNWPKASHILSRRISRIEGVLADTGILVDTSRAGHQMTRTITITKRADAADAIFTSDSKNADAADAADALFTADSRNADAADAADAIFTAQNHDETQTLQTLPESSVCSKRLRSNPHGERVLGFADAADAISPLVPLKKEREEKGIGEIASAASAASAWSQNPPAERVSEDLSADATADATLGKRLQASATNPLYGHVGQTVYTAEGAAQLIQVFSDRVAVQYPARGKVTYLSPDEVAIDEMLL